jgi:hypothetical protein
VTLTGGSGITVTSVAVTSCGPLVPLLDAPATYDPVTKTISLTIADTNRWTREVVAPARDYAWNDSIVITTPTGLVNGTAGTYLRLTGMDSTIGATAATFKNARLWWYDTLLAAHGQPQILYPTGKTRQRTIKIQIVSGAPTVFTLLVRVQTQNANPVAATPPDSQPSWLADDSARLHTGRWSNGFMSKYALAVKFKSGTAQSLKQSAIDSVKGRVIGGFPMVGMYIVQVPTDTSGTALLAAAAKLMTLSQVLTARPYMATGVGPSSLRPKDGPSWSDSSWQLRRDSTRGTNWALERITAQARLAKVEVAVGSRGRSVHSRPPS